MYQGLEAFVYALLTCQSNRFIDANTQVAAKTITVNGDGVSVQAFSPFLPTAAYSAATNGGSGYFDGSGDGVSATLTSATPGTGDFTYEGWYYRLPSTSTYGYDAFSTRSGDTADGISMAFLDTGAILVGYTGVNFINTSSGVFNTGAWAHIAVVRSSGTITLWVNGVSQGTSSRADNFTSTSFNLGNWDVGLSPGFYGYISNFRYTTTAVYTSTFTPPTAPVTNITNTKLLLNFTNAGIIDNTAKNDLITIGNAQISTTQSKFGGASIYLDGNDNCVIPNSENFNFRNGDFTIELWYYPSTLTVVNAHILDFGDGLTGGQNGWNVGFFGGANPDKLGFIWTYDGTNENKIQDASSLTTGSWYFVTVVRSGNSLVLYKDGVSVASTTLSGAIATSNRPLVIGSNQSLGSGYVNGYIDDIRITKGYARYTSGFTPPTKAFPLS